MTQSGFVSENQLYAQCVTLFKPRKQQQKQPRGCLCLSSNFTVKSHSSEVSASCEVALMAHCKKEKKNPLEMRQSNRQHGFLKNYE